MKMFVCAGVVLCASCSPLKSSPNDGKHQLELTLHEVQTNLDDLRHDINCFQTELQIVDGRIKYFENTLATLKQHDLEKQQAKIDQISAQIQALEKKWLALEREPERGSGGTERPLFSCKRNHSRIDSIQRPDRGIRAGNPDTK